MQIAEYNWDFLAKFMNWIKDICLGSRYHKKIDFWKQIAYPKNCIYLTIIKFYSTKSCRVISPSRSPTRNKSSYKKVVFGNKFNILNIENHIPETSWTTLQFSQRSTRTHLLINITSPHNILEGIKLQLRFRVYASATRQKIINRLCANHKRFAPITSRKFRTR